jgi:hypothetical protein
MSPSTNDTSCDEACCQDRYSDDWRTLILAATHLGTVSIHTVTVNDKYL